MIGRLQGDVIEKQPPHLLVDVQGVGYELEVSMSTFYRLPSVGSKVELFTHFVVREDAQLLYGFYTKEERTLFRTLIKVNGVGPKLALTILSGIEANEFSRCVANDDIAALVRLPGVGKKTAERLIVEMRDKLNDWMPANSALELGSSGGDIPLGVSSVADSRQEAESALIALGYKPAQATKSIAVAMRTVGEKDVENLIRHALKSMV